ncbi:MULTISPECIES: hypothetical protein [unclassified Coleofasciculus]|uniref:hypothetical protein n=1 Tax=unclassified Coleofasciculus TaxID=2692782 RepID=UPI00187EB5FF|nr:MULTISPECIES: hypothetical protein [unclassified Coleofasciculus]MBE9126869.1 hypothetical protein [Coleofasciculus sp. LEGE 07081]MBE9150234.1 hypothetical protein [Coleofasciculus sp. LEGE 07092]
MKVEWKNLLARTTVWLAAEILLNLLGLDNLADYSEFIFEKHEVADFLNPERSHPIRFPTYSLEGCTATTRLNHSLISS